MNRTPDTVLLVALEVHRSAVMRQRDPASVEFPMTRTEQDAFVRHMSLHHSFKLRADPQGWKLTTLLGMKVVDAAETRRYSAVR